MKMLGILYMVILAVVLTVATLVMSHVAVSLSGHLHSLAVSDGTAHHYQSVFANLETTFQSVLFNIGFMVALYAVADRAYARAFKRKNHRRHTQWTA